ncbi:MAG TPA: cupredoxin domain-containing protein [Longimicrobiaceae bacterium]|nr:cupredoxin domain-containing protein [Longimicrobiaceae bacterium]
MTTISQDTSAAPRLAGTARLAIAALGGIVAASVLMMVRMYSVAGEVAPPIFAFALLPAVAAVGVWRRRRWAAWLGAVAGAAIVLMIAPHLAHILAVPADVTFTPAVLLAAFALTAAVLATLTAVQHRRPARGTGLVPRWVPVKLGAVGGLLAGIFLMASLPQAGSAAVSPELLSRLPAVEAEKFDFVQREVRVRAGETVALRLENRDAASHSFDLDEADVHVLMPPGETALAVFTAPEPGTYTFYCAPHYDRGSGKGMKGTLIVEP